MARIIQIAILIYREPAQWTRPMLAEKFQVNKATIQRDIDLLREMDIEIVPQGKRGYVMRSDFFKELIDTEEGASKEIAYAI